MTATTARVRAAVRDLERHGDITPAGARVLANICDHEELQQPGLGDNLIAIRMHQETADAFAFINSLPAPWPDDTDYDDIPTTAIPYDEESN